MAQLFYGHILAGGVRIQYYRTGGIKPPLIFLHGLGDNALCWNRLPLMLELEYDVVLMDARGHGASGLDERGASPQVQAADVGMLIESLNLHRPVLIGHSMGALSAALTAVLYPKWVRGVVLEDPPWLDFMPGNGFSHQQKRLEDWRSWLAAMQVKPFDEIVAEGKRQHPQWDESEFFQWAKAKQQVRLSALDWLIQPQPDWREIIRQVRCPGLLISGETRLGAVIGDEVARQVERGWRNCKIVRLMGAGHNVHREAYLEFLRATTAFLKQLGK